MSSRSRNGKNTYNLRKKYSSNGATTRRTAIYPIERNWKLIELPCSSWRSPPSLSHSSSCYAGRGQQEGSVTPTAAAAVSRDPCGRKSRIQPGSNPHQQRCFRPRDPQISDQISHGQGPTSRPAATGRAKIGVFRRRNHQPCNQSPAGAQRTTRDRENLHRRQCSCRHPPRHLSH